MYYYNVKKLFCFIIILFSFCIFGCKNNPSKIDFFNFNNSTISVPVGTAFDIEDIDYKTNISDFSISVVPNGNFFIDGLKVKTLFEGEFDLKILIKSNFGILTRYLKFVSINLGDTLNEEEEILPKLSFNYNYSTSFGASNVSHIFEINNESNRIYDFEFCVINRGEQSIYSTSKSGLIYITTELNFDFKLIVWSTNNAQDNFAIIINNDNYLSK